MQHWLASAGDQVRQRWVKRFDPRYWTVDFPRPMMASAVTDGADALVVEAEFLTRADLAGVIWDSEDRAGHPLLRLATARDYRGTVLRFRWRQTGGARRLDAVNGPTLTIEGRDEAGVARAWFVRLWNHASGAPDDAEVVLDFDALDAGFSLPAEAERVWAGDVDRMFISLVAEGYDGVALPLQAPVSARITLSDIRCDGPGSVVRAGDAFVPPHGLAICSGYDDSYNQTPERMLEDMLALGWRGRLVHYVGMSHFPALAWDAASGAYLVRSDVPLCGPALAWHRDFVARALAMGFEPVLSLSFELLDQHCPDAWAQRNADGARGLTGYEPPSALLSPAESDAMAWLQAVARTFAQMMIEAGAVVRFQIGEPWWWVGPDLAPCLYDAATVALWQASAGGPPPMIEDVRGPLWAEARDYLDWCGALLGSATLALRDAVRDEVADGAGAELLLLFYAPQVLDLAAPELLRANLPLAWAAPAFDVLQLEDYEFVTREDLAGQRRARDVVAARLGYPLADQHYFSGFAEHPDDWPAIMTAAGAALRRGVAEVFIWAWPQVARDGLVAFSVAGGTAAGGEDEVDGFHDVLFPLALGMGATGGPAFLTQVAVTGSGHEQRNQQWADARLRFDAGPGVRSEAELAALIGFFRARRGQAFGFRFRDPLDHGSAAWGQAVGPLDQPLGVGDGTRTRFRLMKTYPDGDAEGGQQRVITRPVPDSVRVAVAGVEQTSGWSLEPGGWIEFAEAPAAGAVVSAGYLFDVPVRFADDGLAISLPAWRAGEVPSVPLVALREG